MNGLNFNIILLVFCLLPFELNSKSSELSNSIITYDTTDDERNKKKRGDFLKKIVPRTIGFQFAGSIGMIAIGPEWSYGKNRQWSTALLIGYLPRHDSDRAKATITLKQNFSPWSIRLKDNITISPLNCGLFFNTIYSHQFWSHEPDRYPEGYYGLTTRIRTHIYVGQSLNLRVKNRYQKGIESFSFYYELNTCDLYIASYFPNMKYLNITDIIGLGFGIKINLK